MSAKLSDLPTASPDAIMAAIDLGNLAFWEARKEREEAEYRLGWAAYEVALLDDWTSWPAEGDLRRSSRALTLTAWFNRADD